MGLDAEKLRGIQDAVSGLKARMDAAPSALMFYVQVFKGNSWVADLDIRASSKEEALREAKRKKPGSGLKYFVGEGHKV